MRYIQSIAGRVVFVVLWPLFYVLLKRSQRTRVVLLCNDEILLVQGWLRGDDSWSLPGGGIHKGELPAVGAVREVKEELGVQLKPGDLVAIGVGTQAWKGFTLNFHAFGIKLQHKPSIVLSRLELQHARWFPLTDIEKVSLQPATEFALQHWSATKNRVNL